MADEPDEASEDALLGGLVRLLQPRRGHRAGTDAVLAARLSGAVPGERIVDLGSASGAIGLMIAATVPETRVVMVERDPMGVRLARKNIALNGVDARAGAIELDLFASSPAWRAAWAGTPFAPGEADLVVTNPPFLGDEARASPDAGRRQAHVMTGGDLGGWVAAARRLLRPQGRLAMIHRADALAACLGALSPGFGGIVVRAIQPRVDADARRIVIVAGKGVRSPLVIRSPLILHQPDGAFTAEAAALHDGRDRPGASSERVGGPQSGAAADAAS